MKRLAFLAVVACLWGCALPGTGQADIITFGTQEIDALFGSTTEGAFTYKVVSGLTWGLVTKIGNPPASLTTGDVAIPTGGQEIDFFLTGGGKFTFDSFDAAEFSSGTSDTVDFIGEVGGVQTQHLDNFGSSSTTFQTMNPGFSAPIDLLRRY
jgi:hypothetical protein